MEKHKCKLCFRSFSNGRALGGHMRSHMMSLPIPPKLEEEEEPPPPPPPPPPPMAAEEADSASSSSSSSSEEEAEAEREEQEEEGDEEKELYYGLRENPKRSIRWVDPEFSFATAVDAASSVILQDRESETESSKNPTRRRSKRTRKSSSISPDHDRYWQYHKAQLVQDSSSPNNKKMIKSSESEPVSSVSDTAATDEDIAYCLMMLSRDNWNRDDEVEDEEADQDDQEDEVDEQDESDNEYEELIKSSRGTRTRGKYKCETCSKVFRSYQALGGHRASHKKIKLYSSQVSAADEAAEVRENAGAAAPTYLQKKVHECPVCLRVFASGQALGGHKRSHVIISTTTTTTTAAAIHTSSAPQRTQKQTQTPTSDVKNPSVDVSSTKKSSNKFGEISVIDLNLPAPDDEEDDDDDEISQVELSAVSDAEFVNPVR